MSCKILYNKHYINKCSWRSGFSIRRLHQWNKRVIINNLTLKYDKIYCLTVGIQFPDFGALCSALFRLCEWVLTTILCGTSTILVLYTSIDHKGILQSAGSTPRVPEHGPPWTEGHLCTWRHRSSAGTSCSISATQPRMYM